MNQRYLRSLNIRLIGLILVALTALLGVFSFLSLRAFESALVPEIAQKADDVGRAITALVIRTAGYGIDVHNLVGTDVLFKDIHDDNPEFEYMAISGTDGKVLYHRGDAPTGLVLISQPGTHRIGDQYVVAHPITLADRSIGWLAIGIPESFVANLMREVLLDLLAVLVVALFLTYELLYFVAGSRLDTQMAAMGEVMEASSEGDLSKRVGLRSDDEFGSVLRKIDLALDRVNAAYTTLGERLRTGSGAAFAEARASFDTLVERFHFGRHVIADEARGDGFLGRVRTPLFLFIFAEEMSRSYLPLYIKQLSTSVKWISPQLVIGIPIMVFMFVVALSQPAIGAWSERVGRRRVFLIGALVGFAGFALTALAQNLYDLLLWRSLTAVGYGMVFGAAQGFVLDNSSLTNRSRGLALFIGAIMVAGTCGPSIGGILADNIGFRATFIVSTVLTLAAALVVWRNLPNQPAIAADAHVRLADVGTLLRNPRFLALMLSASVPAKIILTSFCFYLVPLYITSIGSNPSTTGRLLMLYAIMMVFLTPVAAQLSDRVGKRPIFVAVGLALSGFGGLLLLAGDSIYTLLAVVILLGIGQAISIAPQSALVGELVRSEQVPMSESAVYGVFRLIERLGNTVGPLIAALVLTKFGFVAAFGIIGGFVVLCSALFFITMRSTPQAGQTPIGLSSEMGMAG